MVLAYGTKKNNFFHPKLLTISPIFVTTNLWRGIKMDTLIKITTFFVLICWGVLGLFFWIPMLTRSIGIFTSSIFIYNLIRKNPRNLKENLEEAIKFYPNGFKLVLSIMKSTSEDKVGDSNYDNVENGKSNSIPFKFTLQTLFEIIGDIRVVKEVITTAAFWGTIILIF